MATIDDLANLFLAYVDLQTAQVARLVCHRWYQLLARRGLVTSVSSLRRLGGRRQPAGPRLWVDRPLPLPPLQACLELLVVSPGLAPDLRQLWQVRVLVIAGAPGVRLPSVVGRLVMRHCQPVLCRQQTWVHTLEVHVPADWHGVVFLDHLPLTLRARVICLQVVFDPGRVGNLCLLGFQNLMFLRVDGRPLVRLMTAETRQLLVTGRLGAGRLGAGSGRPCFESDQPMTLIRTSPSPMPCM